MLVLEAVGLLGPIEFFVQDIGDDAHDGVALRVVFDARVRHDLVDCPLVHRVVAGDFLLVGEVDASAKKGVVVGLAGVVGVDLRGVAAIQSGLDEINILAHPLFSGYTGRLG